MVGCTPFDHKKLIIVTRDAEAYAKNIQVKPPQCFHGIFVDETF